MHPDIQVLKEAGLRPSHIALLLDVSRNTATNWYNGGTPHRWVIDRVRELASAVARAMEEGKLPVAGDNSRTRTALIAHRFYLQDKKRRSTAA